MVHLRWGSVCPDSALKQYAVPESGLEIEVKDAQTHGRPSAFTPLVIEQCHVGRLRTEDVHGLRDHLQGGPIHSFPDMGCSSAHRPTSPPSKYPIRACADGSKCFSCFATKFDGRPAPTLKRSATSWSASRPASTSRHCPARSSPTGASTRFRQSIYEKDFVRTDSRMT
jgi:hypothetical protein